MAQIKKLFIGVVAFFSAKSAIPAISAEEFRSAMERGTHSPEDCQRVTQGHLAKLRSGV